MVITLSNTFGRFMEVVWIEESEILVLVPLSYDLQFKSYVFLSFRP